MEIGKSVKVLSDKSIYDLLRIRVTHSVVNLVGNRSWAFVGTFINATVSNSVRVWSWK